MKHIKYTCDIEGCSSDINVENKILPVMFDHDQEDGKTKTPPYFELLKIDICKQCYNNMIENRRFIYGYGAMGYNRYYL